MTDLKTIKPKVISLTEADVTFLLHFLNKSLAPSQLSGEAILQIADILRGIMNKLSDGLNNLHTKSPTPHSPQNIILQLTKEEFNFLQQYLEVAVIAGPLNGKAIVELGKSLETISMKLHEHDITNHNLSKSEDSEKAIKSVNKEVG